MFMVWSWGKVLVKKFILYRDTVILAMQARNRFLE